MWSLFSYFTAASSPVDEFQFILEPPLALEDFSSSPISLPDLTPQDFDDVVEDLQYDYYQQRIQELQLVFDPIPQFYFDEELVDTSSLVNPLYSSPRPTIQDDRLHRLVDLQ